MIITNNPSDIAKRMKEFDEKIGDLEFSIEHELSGNVSTLLDDWENLMTVFHAFMKYHDEQMTQYADKIAELEDD